MISKPPISKNIQSNNNQNEGLAGAQYGAYVTSNEAAATDEMRKGMDLLKEAAAKSGNRLIDKKQGNLFEYIESAKFNTAAAKQGSSIREQITDALGRPHDPSDGEFVNSTGKVLGRVQYKSFGDGKNSLARQVREISNLKYEDMQRVINREHHDQVKDMLDKAAKRENIYTQDYNNAKKNLKKGTSYGSIKSPGTTHSEAVDAAKDPKIYATKMEIKQGTSEVLNTGGQAAIGGAVIGGAISVTKNALAVSRGEISAGDAAVTVAMDTGKSGLKAGATGGLGSMIRQGAAKLGLNSLAKSNVATTVASTVIDSGVIIYDFVKGEITGEEAAIRLGQTTTSAISGVYAGAAAGLAFGPVGAVIGSIAGYMLASNSYQSCITIFQNAKLSEIEAERVIALCDAAAMEMRKQREAFDSLVKEVLQEKHKEFEQYFDLLDKGITYKSPEISTYALAELTDILRVNLKLANFKEFDEFMMNSKEPLRL